ncbi:two-component system response regulator [Methylocucumis oryzae]|uniref:two-component system response regulator n=1 Tax=Methylocucumis oryzae TaxID=1632867 RepID=UPI000696696A|nr:diguanylate cyclase [Methylocucumis oryzae]
MTAKPKILVIDDDPMTRALVNKSLTASNFDVICAESGDAGLAEIAHNRPDLILLDVMMPGMDGFACLRILIAHYATDVPIIMMTAVEDVHCVEQAFQLGATDFISKPIQWLLLPYRVRYVLRSHHTRQLLIKQQQQLRQSEAQLRLSLAAGKQGLWDYSPLTNEIRVNAEYALMLGYEANEFSSLRLSEWFASIHPEDEAIVKTSFRAYLLGEQSEYRISFRQRCRDGSWRWILATGSIVERDAAGNPLRILGTHTDIQQNKLVEEQLQLLAKVFEHSGEGIILCDADARILSCNQAYCQITGYTQQEIIQQTPKILSIQQKDQAYFAKMRNALKKHSYWQDEVWDVRKNGEQYPVLLGISVVRNQEGRITHYIGIFSDITERKVAEQKIEFLAHHDSLTGLPNRTLLQERFAQALIAASRSHTLVALLFLDLDRFKHINDSLGHDMGDLLLQGIAERLSNCVREADTICRYGGDEFIIILTNLPDALIAERVAEKIIAQLHQPFAINSHQLTTSFSIGISVYPSDGNTLDDLLKKADIAMYQAKKAGRNCYCCFSTEHDACEP